MPQTRNRSHSRDAAPETARRTVQMNPEIIDVWKRPPAPEPREEMGFFTDTTLCIGCKACEVACKQWNQLPADGYEFSGNSYDNTLELSGTTWRHVAFVEQPAALDAPPSETKWLMLSDVCKHCTNAGCLEACPTGSIVRNEFDDVFVQPDVCNGCGYCVPSCPFGVVDLIAPADYDADRGFS